MTKKPFLAVLAVLLALAAGAGAFYVLFPSSYPEPAEDFSAAPTPRQEEDGGSQPPAPLSPSISTADMEKASLVEGITEADAKKNEVLDAASVPSQLSKIKVEGMVGIASASAQKDPSSQQEPQTEETIILNNLQDRALSAPRLEDIVAQDPTANLPEDTQPTSITMLSAPVKVRLIKSTDEYKEFKKIARGKYPQVDFNKQMVVVLESDSNLPDKVFEIQDVQAKDGKLLITYRVNIFDLDSKLNTHTAKAVAKSSLSVELKQVL